MIYEFKCWACDYVLEEKSNSNYIRCPKCGCTAERQFHATSNIFIPSHFHTSRSDIFSDDEWQALKKDPNTQRY